MTRWTFEPGHTAATFKARHMMVTWVRGHVTNIHGTLIFHPEALEHASVEVDIDVSTLWSGESQRDEHLRSADFLDVANQEMGTRLEAVATYENSVDNINNPNLSIRDATYGPAPKGELLSAVIEFTED